MAHESRLDLDRAHRPARGDDDVIGAPGVEEIAVGVHPTAVLDEEPPAPSAHGDLAHGPRRQRLPLGVDDAHLPAGGGRAERPGSHLVSREPGVAHDDHAHLGGSVHAAWGDAERLLDELPGAGVHGLPREGELGGPERVARGDPRRAQETIDSGGRRHVRDLERAERLEDQHGVEPSRVAAHSDAEGERGDGAVPEAVAPRGRGGAEVSVARAQADAVEGRDHERDHGAVGVLDRLRESARRARRVLKHRGIVGRRGGRVLRGLRGEGGFEGRVRGHHAHPGELRLPARGLPVGEQDRR